MGLGARLRFFFEFFVAVMAIAFLVASLAVPDWIEETVGFAPDNGDGSVEWGVSLCAVVVFLIASWLARREWRASRSAASVSAPRAG